MKARKKKAAAAPVATRSKMTPEEARGLVLLEVSRDELSRRFGALAASAAKRLGVPADSIGYDMGTCEWVYQRAVSPGA